MSGLQLESIMPDLIGKSLGRYHILEQISDGGNIPSANKATNKRISAPKIRLFVKIRGRFARST